MKMKLIIVVAAIIVVILPRVKALFYPGLESIDTTKLHVVSETASPDSSYKLKIYVMGGALLNSDYSYIGEVEFDHHTRRKVFWIGGNTPAEPKWVDDHTIEIADQRIDILKDQYDFRWE
ncbi:DUF5412 family protein [Brevibacillus fulvus]|uniref:Uncharacterized protein n=1 Tax=Brevibacillus fulvus TaxID=1125967 RepID=A0A938XWY5_9BACL|nr:DUF5412 family protein [Brevibacillus fulvus]MBM7591712.1 hypothetical protein [Brevibacillus fulvus]